MKDINKISIIIPTYHRQESLLRLLDSISRQNFNLEDLEVIVVSNLQDAELNESLKLRETDLFTCRYFEVGKVGVNLARNLGVGKSTGEIILFLDDDCELQDKLFLQFSFCFNFFIGFNNITYLNIRIVFKH